MYMNIKSGYKNIIISNQSSSTLFRKNMCSCVCVCTFTGTSVYIAHILLIVYHGNHSGKKREKFIDKILNMKKKTHSVWNLECNKRLVLWLGSWVFTAIYSIYQLQRAGCYREIYSKPFKGIEKLRQETIQSHIQERQKLRKEKRNIRES